MKSVLVIEKNHLEAVLISRRLKELDTDTQVYTDLMEGGSIDLKKIHVPLNSLDLVMVNLEEKIPGHFPGSKIEQLRKEMGNDQSYILAWVNPLLRSPLWTSELGKGSFEKKPVEPERMFGVIQKKLEQLKSENRDN